LIDRGLRCIGVPKTIDNDLWSTEVTFGYDTAMTTATEAIDKIHTTASSHHRVMVVEIMGRYAGWLALGAGIAGGADVLLIPEIPFSFESICETCRERGRYGKRFTIIAAGEGAMPAGGEMIVNSVDRHRRTRSASAAWRRWWLTRCGNAPAWSRDRSCWGTCSAAARPRRATARWRRRSAITPSSC
jgi:6-phosphofructokinase